MNILTKALKSLKWKYNEAKLKKQITSEIKDIIKDPVKLRNVYIEILYSMHSWMFKPENIKMMSDENLDYLIDRYLKPKDTFELL